MIPDLLILAVVVVGFLYACGSLSAHSARATNTSATQQHERLRTALICLFNSKYKFATKQVSWLRHPETGKQLTLQHFSSELSLLVHVEYKNHATEKLRRVIVDSGVVYVGVPSASRPTRYSVTFTRNCRPDFRDSPCCSRKQKKKKRRGRKTTRISCRRTDCRTRKLGKKTKKMRGSAATSSQQQPWDSTEMSQRDSTERQQQGAWDSSTRQGGWDSTSLQGSWDSPQQGTWDSPPPPRQQGDDSTPPRRQSDVCGWLAPCLTVSAVILILVLFVLWLWYDYSLHSEEYSKSREGFRHTH